MAQAELLRQRFQAEAARLVIVDSIRDRVLARLTAGDLHTESLWQRLVQAKGSSSRRRLLAKLVSHVA